MLLLHVCPYCEESTEGPVCQSCGSLLAAADDRTAETACRTEWSHCPYCDVEVAPAAGICQSCGSLL